MLEILNKNPNIIGEIKVKYFEQLDSVSTITRDYESTTYKKIEREKNGKKKVYIIYRYNNVDAGKVLANIGVAYRVAFDLIQEGYIPFIPHGDFLLAIMFGHQLDLQFYYDYSIEWQKACDAVCIVDDGQEPSDGCKKEIELARQWKQEMIYRKANLEI